MRSRVLNGEMSETEVRPYLSGLLIGREITAAVSASRDQPQELVLLGAQALARLYEAATQQLGFAVRLISGDVVAKGLFQLSLSLQDGPLQGQGD